MKSASKALLLTLVLVVFTSMAFGQDGAEVAEADSTADISVQEGTIAGKDDASSNGLYILGGVVFGPLAIIAAAISDPQPDPQKINLLEQAMGADYVSAYSSSFSNESRKNNLIYAATGFGITVVAVAILVAIVLHDLSNTDFWVSGDDYYR